MNSNEVEFRGTKSLSTCPGLGRAPKEGTIRGKSFSEVSDAFKALHRKGLVFLRHAKAGNRVGHYIPIVQKKPFKDICMDEAALDAFIEFGILVTKYNAAWSSDENTLPNNCK